ncbi:hypothetical protein ABZ814_31930 [Micromonospora musae]
MPGSIGNTASNGLRRLRRDAKTGEFPAGQAGTRHERSLPRRSPAEALA